MTRAYYWGRLQVGVRQSADASCFCPLRCGRLEAAFEFPGQFGSEFSSRELSHVLLVERREMAQVQVGR